MVVTSGSIAAAGRPGRSRGSGLTGPAESHLDGTQSPQGGSGRGRELPVSLEDRVCLLPVGAPVKEADLAAAGHSLGGVELRAMTAVGDSEGSSPSLVWIREES